MPAKLRRELGLFDLTLMLVIAVVNINGIPFIAAAGWHTVPLWLIAFLLFLIPQGLAVAEFGKLYPGEGGIYLWTREMFGDFHAFISGWCYWANNLFYYPAVLFVLVGVLVYTGGASSASLGANPHFMAIGALCFLWLITLIHIRGLSLGKWLNNIGAFGTWFGLLIILITGITMWIRKGPATPISAAAFSLSFRNYTDYSTFSLMLYGLVGLELGSAMGDEIKDVVKIIGKAALLGGTISILLYMIGTVSLLLAVPAEQIGAVQGLMQAVTIAAKDLDMMMIIRIVAVLLAFAVLGVCAAWMAGAARVPFVMGIDVYLPSALGRTHSKWGTPYVALLVQAVLSSLFILISLFGSTVKGGYEFLLKSSVVLQLIPFLYLFAGLYKLGKKRMVGLLGLAATAFGIAFVFVPSSAESNIFSIAASTAVMLGLALIFYFVGRSRRAVIVSS